ncbi:hypothetical protein [Streptomyces sp. NPDC048428]|uniref:hypothetical protein n=1 Tax=Streptomyces sp. NPDC048428 TaxID=3154503 RepID=UPI003416470D
MIHEPPRPPWQMDWTKQAQHDFQNMPAEGSDLVMSARAELVTAEDRTSGESTPTPRSRTG